MPRTCTICTHEQRPEIDAALFNGEALRDIAGRVPVSKSALARHAAEHIPAHLVKAKDAETVAQADTLLDKLKEINRETREVLADAKLEGDGELRLKALTRLEKQLELEGKLLGELQSGPVVNVTLTPEWLSLTGCRYREP